MKPGKQNEVAVDFDGTLAENDPRQPFDVNRLGAPIPEMVAKVKALLAQGAHVRIFTARVNPGIDYQRALDATKSFLLIAQWCQKNLGVLLPIVFIKSPDVAEWWDDSAKEILKNSGLFLTELVDAAERQGRAGT